MSKSKKVLKKSLVFSLSLILALILGISAIPAQAMAASPINFECPNFEAAVRELDGVPDTGNIYPSHVAGITHLDVIGRYISDLTGIEYFAALSSLNAIGNQLTSLNVTQNSALQILYVAWNQLTSLDVSQNTALQRLNVNQNQLASLDVTSNTALNMLDVTANQLTSIDVTNNTALNMLGVSVNQLTSIDVTSNTSLTQLWTSENQLTSLDVTTNTALNVLVVDQNQLTSLDVSRNEALGVLSAHNNQLTSLDVSRNEALYLLFVTGNQLTELNVSQGLIQLSVFGNQLTELNVSNNAHLVSLNASGNRLVTLDVSQNTALTTLLVDNNYLPSINAIIGLGDTQVDVNDPDRFRFNPQRTVVVASIPEDVIEQALGQENPRVELSTGDSTVISDTSLQAIGDSGRELDIVLPCGREVTISNVGDNPRSIDLDFGVRMLDTGTRINNVQFPANTIVIEPTVTGEFGFMLSLTISEAELHAAGLRGNNFRLFHIRADGSRTELNRVQRNADGSVTISMSRASVYVLSEVAPTDVGDTDTWYAAPYVAAVAPAPVAHDVPQTGITGRMILPLVLGLLGFALVAGTIGHRIYVRKKDKS